MSICKDLKLKQTMKGVIAKCRFFDQGTFAGRDELLHIGEQFGQLSICERFMFCAFFVSVHRQAAAAL